MRLRNAIVAKEQRETSLFELGRDFHRCVMVGIDTATDPAVTDEPGFVWVRELDQGGGVFKCFNPGVQRIVNLPVLVARTPQLPDRLSIVDVDFQTLIYSSTYDGETYQPNHAADHEWPDFDPGGDPLTVYPRAFSQLRTYAGSSAVSISVYAYRYSKDGAVVEFEGESDIDLSASLPSAADPDGTWRFVLVYLDTETNTIQTVDGDTAPTSVTPPKPDCPLRGIPSAYIALGNTSTGVITESMIYDARMPFDLLVDGQELRIYTYSEDPSDAEDGDMWVLRESGTQIGQLWPGVLGFTRSEDDADAAYEVGELWPGILGLPRSGAITGDGVYLKVMSGATKYLVRLNPGTNVYVDDILMQSGVSIGIGPGDERITFYDDSRIVIGGATLELSAWVRATTSTYRRYYHLPLASLDPGASGATWTDPSADSVGGWQLDAAGEILHAAVDIHADWDGATDPTVELHFDTNVNNGGGLVTDTVDIKVVAYYKGVGDTSTKSQTVEVATVVGQAAQFKHFKVELALNWDAGGNVIEVGDQIMLQINLETDTSEVDDIILTGGSFFYPTTHVGIESGDA